MRTLNIQDQCLKYISIDQVKLLSKSGIISPLESPSCFFIWASLVAQMVKNPPAMQDTWVRSLSWEDPLEKGKATHSSVLAWRSPWTKEAAGLQSMGSQRVGHD